MAGQSYRDLIAWQKAMDLVEAVYAVTRSFPKEELYGGLTSQIRKAAVSVPSNIAEGQARRSVKEFVRYLGIARGSLCEMETQLQIAARLRYITAEKTSDLLARAAELGRLLNGLINSLRSRLPEP